jgi:hypothetical protein
MSAAVLERDVQGEEVNSARAGEETCRRKIVALREGLRDVFYSHGVALSQGASNDDLLSSVAQLCGKQSVRHSERLDTSWQEEYKSVAQGIGSLVGEGHFTADTEPTEIIQTVQSRYVPDEREV